MRLISIRNIGLVLAGIVLFAMLLFAGFLVNLANSIPSDDVVKREFLTRYPHSTISEIELIFEQDGGVTYLVKAKERGMSADGTYDFSLSRSGSDWKWCDDQTERKCGPIRR